MKRLAGGLLLAAGILVMTCSGLCSLYVIVAGFSDAMRDPSLILWPLLFGGIPFLCGFGMFYGGRAIVRDERRRTGLSDKDVRRPFE